MSWFTAICPDKAVRREVKIENLQIKDCHVGKCIVLLVARRSVWPIGINQTTRDNRIFPPMSMAKGKLGTRVLWIAWSEHHWLAYTKDVSYFEVYYEWFIYPDSFAPAYRSICVGHGILLALAALVQIFRREKRGLGDFFEGLEGHSQQCIWFRCNRCLQN